MLFIILKDSMCIARRALNGVDGVLSVVFLPYPNSGEEMARCRGVARTIPPGGYKKFRLGWVWGGGTSRICQL